MDRGNVFSFQSEVLDFVTTPVKLIFVTYPEIIVRHSMRKVQRVEYPLFTEVDVSHERFEGLIKDISVRGCWLSIIAQSPTAFLSSIEVGQMLSISFALSGIYAPTILTGQVKSVQREGQKLLSERPSATSNLKFMTGSLALSRAFKKCFETAEKYYSTSSQPTACFNS